MKKRNSKTVGIIKFGKERKETFYRFDIKVEPKLETILIKYAKKRIINDREALINYAINGILREEMDRNKTKKKDKMNNILFESLLKETKKRGKYE